MKRCPRCGLTKPVLEFNLNQSYCRTCQANYYKENPKHQEQVKRRAYEQREYVSKWVKEYKLGEGCLWCGYKKCASALHFHHIGSLTKTKEISTMVANGLSISTVKKEISKCLLLCSNCHAEETERLRNSIGRVAGF